MNRLLSNWKTTSAGLALLVGAIVHLVFAIKHDRADETTWNSSLLTLIAAIGLMFAGDASASIPKSEQAALPVTPDRTKGRE